MSDEIKLMLICSTIIIIILACMTGWYRGKALDFAKQLKKQNKGLCRTCVNCSRHDGTRVHCDIAFYNQEKDRFVGDNCVFLDDAITCKYYIEKGGDE